MDHNSIDMLKIEDLVACVNQIKMVVEFLNCTTQADNGNLIFTPKFRDFSMQVGNHVVQAFEES